MSILKVFLLSLIFTLGLYAKVPDLVSVEWLKTHYNDVNLVLIDVRAKKVFDKEHLKRAVNLPVFKTLFVGEHLMLPKLSDLKELFSKAGIDAHTTVVVYGGEQPIWAARFYWISYVLGHHNVGLLNVSYGNWKKNELATTTKIFTPKYKNFVPMIDNSVLATSLDTLASINKNYILDGRPYAFYIGKKSHAKRYGHIPSALNYPGSLTYSVKDGKSSVKDMNSLKKIYKTLPKDKKVILYCEDGADAAMNFLVLKKLGYDVSVYEGSWLEWGNLNKLPIETKPNLLKE